MKFFRSLIGLFALAAVALSASPAAAYLTEGIGLLAWHDPRPHLHLLGQTPRSIIETRRLGLA